MPTEGPYLIMLFCSVQNYEGKRRRVAIGSCATLPTFGVAEQQWEDAQCIPDRVNNQIDVNRRFDEVLRSQLAQWTKHLLKLQPKVHMSPHIMECGLCLFKVLRKRQLVSWAQGKLPKAYVSNRDLMIHDLIACWWIAMKHCSVRTAVPNRTLLSRATQAKDLLLADCELAALLSLKWDVNHVLRMHGLIHS